MCSNIRDAVISPYALFQSVTFKEKTMLQKTWWEENEPFGILFYIRRLILCWIAVQFGTVTIRYYRDVWPFVDHHWYEGGVEVRHRLILWESTPWKETTWSIFGRVVSTSETRMGDGHVGHTWIQGDYPSKEEYLKSITNFFEEIANPEGYETTGAVAKHGVPSMAAQSAAWLSCESNQFSC